MVAPAFWSDSLKAADDLTHGEQFQSSSEIQCLSTWLKLLLLFPELNLDPRSCNCQSVFAVLVTPPSLQAPTNAFRDEDYRTKYTICRTWLKTKGI